MSKPYMTQRSFLLNYMLSWLALFSRSLLLLLAWHKSCEKQIQITDVRVGFPARFGLTCLGREVGARGGDRWAAQRGQHHPG